MGRNHQDGNRKLVLPKGTPAWITPELVRLTLEVWQKHAAEPLSVEDAVAMIQNAAELMLALVEEGSE